MPNPTIDIFLAAAILLAITLSIFYLTKQITRKWTLKQLTALGIAAVAAIIAFAIWLFDGALLLKILPFRNAIFLANLLMPLSAILAGVAFRVLPIPSWRRYITAAGVMLIAAIITFRPIIAHKPTVGDRWKRGVCMQTTWATCSPAAEVNLLKLHGIDSTEAEMAALSLTTRRGTLFHGVYRGLVLRTENSPWRVRVISGSIDDLKKVNQPVLIRVGTGRWQNVDRSYETEMGWTPGVTHSVVLLRFRDDGGVDVADPSVGPETWSIENLKTLWHGVGFVLEKR